MPRPPVVGLLPLYIALYDQALPALRGKMRSFLNCVENWLIDSGFQVNTGPVCCTRAEFQETIARLEESRPDLLITLHLAYSPSLESAEILSRMKMPLLMLDTTPDVDFGLDVDPERLLENHGIHGLQDLAVMLHRMGKDYEVAAGHLGSPRLRDKVLRCGKASAAAQTLKTMRVLRVGSPFAGMGDFQVDAAVLKEKIGIELDAVSLDAVAAAANAISDDDIAEENIRDRARYQVDAPEDVLTRSNRVGLGLRKILDQGSYGAFSMNFLAFDRPDGPACTVPFLECCKAMERGLGYAGEGDVLTASLVGALGAAIGPVTFTEMFSPDWQGGSVFLSHMGEFNPALAVGRVRIFEKTFSFTPAQNPAAMVGALAPGPALLVNLAPVPRDSFRLIVAPVEALGDGTHPHLAEWIRGWIRPAVQLESFLETYSRLGGTHHCALLPGGDIETLALFARFCELDFQTIA